MKTATEVATLPKPIRPTSVTMVHLQASFKALAMVAKMMGIEGTISICQGARLNGWG